MFPTGSDRAGGTARRTPQKEGGSASKETKPPLCPVTGLLFRAVGVGDQNTTAVFADDDLLALTDIGLALRRNPIEAAAARIALDGHYGQPVVHVAANPVVGCQQALVDLGLGDVRLLAEFGDLRSRLLLDALQLALFHLQIGFPVGDDPFGLFQQRLLGLDSGRVLFETLFGQFDFELLILDLLGNGAPYSCR